MQKVNTKFKLLKDLLYQIADNINHCPLCGRDISGHEPVLEETFECYPNNKIWVDKRNFSISSLI